MLSGLIIVLSPVFVTAITSVIKMLPEFATLTSSRKPIIRLVAGVVSLVYVSVGIWLNPDLVNTEGVLDTVVADVLLAFVAWVGSIGTYHTFVEK